MTTQETRRTAARWLERTQHPNWNAEDQAALDAWLTESGNRVAYLRIKAFWKRTDRLTALRRPQTTRQPMRPGTQTQNRWPALRKAAAGLVLTAVIGAVAWQQWDMPKQETYVTAIGGHKVITFKDGTRIELNTDTVLRVAQNSSTRKVWLDRGEAYFEVEHDPSRPFTVIANTRKVTDLGTKFAVRQDADRLRVTVVEGLVEVEAKDQKPQSLLRPGDVLTATPQSQSIVRKPLRNLRAGLDWNHGKLFFDYITLAEAAAEFNRYNTRKLIIKDARAAKLTVAGTFSARNLETFTSVARDVFGLKAEMTEDQIVLSH